MSSVIDRDAESVCWVDDVCRLLGLPRQSSWLPWGRREQTPGLGAGEGLPPLAGVFVVGWGVSADALDVVHVGEAADLGAALHRLESNVKWGVDHGFVRLREYFENRDDHRTMAAAWLWIVPVEEEAMLPSAMLTGDRLNALGCKRRQLAAVLLAEHFRRFGRKVPGNEGSKGLFLHDLVVTTGTATGQVAA